MIKLAVLGTGMIAGEALKALRSVPEVEVRTIWARPASRHKAEALAEEFGVGSVSTDLDALLSDGNIDFVYVGLVNNVHYEFSRRALLRGKNVILEKPSCPSAAQIEALARLACERGLYLFEAVTFLHAPFFADLKSRLPELAPLRLAVGNYSKYSSRYDRYLKGDVAPAFDPACNGGALLDLNIYNINFFVSLLGRPEKVSYVPRRGFNGVDTSGTACLLYPEMSALCIAAKDSGGPSSIIIEGERGWLRIEGTPDNFKYWEICTAGKTERYSLERTEHRMTDEFRHFNQIFSQKQYDVMKSYLRLSVQVARVAEAAQRSAATRPATWENLD